MKEGGVYVSKNTKKKAYIWKRFVGRVGSWQGERIVSMPFIQYENVKEQSYFFFKVPIGISFFQFYSHPESIALYTSC